MKAALKAAGAGCALIAMSLTFSVAVAASTTGTVAQMRLVSTNTSEPYPFAAIVVNHVTYHVTEGDVLDGVSIRRISPGRVALSGNRVLVAARQPRDDRDDSVSYWSAGR